MRVLVYEVSLDRQGSASLHGWPPQGTHEVVRTGGGPGVKRARPGVLLSPPCPQPPKSGDPAPADGFHHCPVAAPGAAGCPLTSPPPLSSASVLVVTGGWSLGDGVLSSLASALLHRVT